MTRDLPGIRHALRWRLSLGAYGSRLARRRVPETRFVLFAQGRTGSSLLASLLNAHPAVFCDGELLDAKRLFPRAVIDGRARRHPDRVYGFKLKVYHLSMDQKLADPVGFVRNLAADGWRIIHLRRRNVLRQTLSQFVAERRKAYHLFAGQREDLGRMEVDLARVVRHMGWRLRMQELEERALDGLSHAVVHYEDDLMDGARHQATADRLFAFLGLDPAPVTTAHRKITPKRLADFVANPEAVAAAVTEAGLGRFLED
jgi:hypothetical protein